MELVSAAGAGLSLAAAAGGGLAGLSTFAEVALGTSGSGTEAVAPVVFASGLGVEGTELAIGAAFDEGGVLGAMEPCASALVLAVAGDEVEAVSRLVRLEARLDRLEVLLLAALLGGVFVVFVSSAAGGGAGAALGAGVCVAALVSASAVAAVLCPGLLASATIAGFGVDGGGVVSELLRL